ncbi:MAG TPA: hypothetical protein VFU86_07900 [Terriglobales bacterium]|nr:hypothetical protein [Terriglobales bacterium]
MRKRNSTIAAALLATALLGATLAGRAQQGGSSLDVAKWKTYHDEQNSFDLKYPPDWHVSWSSGPGQKLIAINSPEQHKVPFTVAVQMNQNPKKLSIEDWFADQLKRMNTKPESQGETKVGNQPAVFMENTNSFGKRRSVFTSLHGKDVLTVIYEPDTKFEPVYKAILDSFRAR